MRHGSGAPFLEADYIAKIIQHPVLPAT